MNVVTLLGRMTKDAEVRYSQGDNQTAVARFAIAVDRKSKDAGTDFINCVAFGKTAEVIEKYFGKGKRIGIVGHIQTGSYTNKEGAKVYTTDVVVDSLDFIELKAEGSATSAPADTNGFAPIEEELPFN